MSRESRRLAGVLMVVLPTVVFGGVSIPALLIRDPAYQANPLRQDLWRAGYVHAGVLLLLSLVLLRYAEDARLGGLALGRTSFGPRGGHPPAGGLLLLGPDAGRDGAERRHLPRLRGRGHFSVGLLTLGVGLLRGRPQEASNSERPGGGANQ